MNSAYDCIVIGGGPAGCTTATLLAQAGWHTLLLERERLPRIHVGESLMPETYWTFERLGVLDQIKNSAFVKKTGVRFVSHADNSSHWFDFREHDPRECSTTWQVERADFDNLLLNNARAKGADCFDRAQVQEILFQQNRACGVRVQLGNETARDVSCRVVVDASGQQTLLASQLNVRVRNSERNSIAVWGYYHNAQRDNGEDTGATILLQTTSKKSWFWFVPLSNNITSIGVVADQSHLNDRRVEPAAVFEDQLVECPTLTERLLNAELRGEFRQMKLQPYCVSRRAGDGWVLVGDAGGIVDPIHSAGVMLAMKSAEMAADCLAASLRHDELSAERLAAWTIPYENGVRWLRRLSDTFYAPQFSLSQFLRQYPQYRGSLTDLLMGRVFQADAGRVFEVLSP